MVSTHVSGLVASTTPAWPTSDRHLVVPFGRILRVYDITTHPTPSCISYLEGHSAAVVAVVNAGDMRVASASEDGTVRFWDITDGACLRTVDLGHTILHMCRIHQGNFFCSTNHNTVVVNLAKSQHSKRPKGNKALFPDAVLKAGNHRLVSSGDGSVVATLRNEDVYLASCTMPNRPWVQIAHRWCLTAVCVSHDGSKLAVGNQRGQVIVYPDVRFLLTRSNKHMKLGQADTPNSTLHWHSSPVRGLAFSKDGNHLFSGGHEAVLVTWKMTPNEFGKQSFLPRLGAPILSLSLSNDDRLCALTQANNSVRIVDLVSSESTATIRGISITIDHYHPKKGCDLSSRASPQSLEAVRMTRYPKRPNQVLLSGTGSNLQLYDMYKGQHIADMTIFPRNVVHVSAEREDVQPQPARVTAVEIHPSGRLMATVEVQNLFAENAEGLNSSHRITNFRLWDVNADDEITMTAVFSCPHGADQDVSSVCFHPHLPIAVTTSPRGNFKIWRSLQLKEERRTASWRVEAELGYKALPCSSSCFSSDGSLLAVTCGSLLTLWHIEDLLDDGGADANDPESIRTSTMSGPSSIRFELLHALVHPPAEETLRCVRFINVGIPMFITATDFGIYVWNALTQGIWWSSRIRTKPQTIAVDEKSGFFGIAVQVPATGFIAFGEQDTDLSGTKEVTMECIDDKEELANSEMQKDSNGAMEGLATGMKHKQSKKARRKQDKEEIANSEVQKESNDKDELANGEMQKDSNDAVEGLDTGMKHERRAKRSRRKPDKEELPDSEVQKESNDKDELANDEMQRDSNGAVEGFGTGTKHRKRAKRARKKQKGVRWTEQHVARSLDSAVAIFDVLSPYPLRVLQPSSGADVVSLEFVSSSSSSGGDKSALVYIDTNFDVSFFSPNGDDDGFSAVTSASSTSTRADSTLEGEGKLETLLGKHTGGISERKVARAQQGKLADSQHDPENRNKIFRLVDDIFDGPVHIQAPISAKAADFVRALRSSGSTAKHSERREDVSAVKAGTTMEPSGVMKAAESLETVSIQELDYNACLAMCRNMIETRGPEGKGSRKSSKKKNSGGKGREKQAAVKGS